MRITKTADKLLTPVASQERLITEDEVREAGKAAIAELPVISTANAENDDWLKKAYPEHQKQELEILEDLRKKFEAEGR